MNTEKKHLWEIKHPYYCNEGNYFANESVGEKYLSWAEFFEDEGDSDPDYNLLFRWDWEMPVDEADKIKIHPDPNYRDSTLKLFWMGQRKGLYRYTLVSVCRADEPAIRTWLETRLTHLKRLWEPL